MAGIGSHASRNRGAGLEFAQYRAYEPGDEVRQVDWKLYARSERLFVREAERESPLTLWIVIDASASMGQGDAARPGWSRLDAAKLLAVCLAELALAGGDRFGWIVPGARGVVAAPADGRRHRDRLRRDLADVAVAGRFAGANLAPLYERIGAHDLVVVLSDLFDDAVVAMMIRLAAARRDVAAVQVLTADERDFPFADGRCFVDPETGAEVVGDGPTMRADFVRDFAAARAALAARLTAGGVRLATNFLDEAADVPLRALFGTPR
jgi:uncharacterized protein (DUF58 family)